MDSALKDSIGLAGLITYPLVHMHVSPTLPQHIFIISAVLSTIALTGILLLSAIGAINIRKDHELSQL